MTLLSLENINISSKEELKSKEIFISKAYKLLFNAKITGGILVSVSSKLLSSDSMRYSYELESRKFLASVVDLSELYRSHLLLFKQKKVLTITEDAIANDFRTLQKLTKSLNSLYSTTVLLANKIDKKDLNNLLTIFSLQRLSDSVTSHNKSLAALSYKYYLALETTDFNADIPFINFSQSIGLATSYKKAAVNIIFRTIKELISLNNDNGKNVNSYLDLLYESMPELFIIGAISSKKCIRVIELTLGFLMPIANTQEDKEFNNYIEELAKVYSSEIKLLSSNISYEELYYIYNNTSRFALIKAIQIFKSYSSFENISQDSISTISKFIDIFEENRTLYTSLTNEKLSEIANLINKQVLLIDEFMDLLKIYNNQDSKSLISELLKYKESITNFNSSAKDIALNIEINSLVD